MNTLKKLVVEYLTEELGLEAIPHKCGGVPLFKGTRYSPSHFLAEILGRHRDESVPQIADDLEIPFDEYSQFFFKLALLLDTPIT